MSLILLLSNRDSQVVDFKNRISHKIVCCPGNANKIVEALHVFEAIGVETNFEKMIEISLKRMLAQSQTMLQQLIEAE